MWKQTRPKMRLGVLRYSVGLGTDLWQSLTPVLPTTCSTNWSHCVAHTVDWKRQEPAR